MAKKELIPAKQEKAYERIKNFRGELADYRQTLERLKKDREDSVMLSPKPTQSCTLCSPLVQLIADASHSYSKPLKIAQSC